MLPYLGPELLFHLLQQPLENGQELDMTQATQTGHAHRTASAQSILACLKSALLRVVRGSCAGGRKQPPPWIIDRR